MKAMPLTVEQFFTDLAALYREDDETEWRKALQRGDRHAQAQLYRRYAPTLLRATRRIVRDDAVAWDCVQDSFVKAYQGIGQFAGRSRLKSWLYRIAINHALMHCRQNRQRKTVSLQSFCDEHGDFYAGSDLWGTPSCPVQNAVQTEAQQRISQVLKQLSPTDQEMIQLRDLAQWDGHETAKCLGIQVGAVKTRLHRARQAFKRHWHTLEMSSSKGNMKRSSQLRTPDGQ